MNSLKVVANEMLPVYENENGEKLVDARELHEQLMVSTRFNDWITRMISNYGFTEGEDFYSFLSKTTGRPSTEYLLTMDTAKEIAMVQNNETGRVVRKYFIKIEKQAKQQPQTQAEMLLLYAQQMVEQERKVQQLTQKVEETERKVEGISEIVALNSTDWRKDTTAILNKIAFKTGGFDQYGNIRNESYELLEQRANANLGIRVTNKKKKMALEGVAKSKVDKVSKLDVIDDDKRLLEIYLAVVKEMAIRYGIDYSRIKEESA
ncbi:antA/AntB antirepressor family protein [Ectobacillus sp. JY-23]|uniref:antA/AntB antirepressor family protein n=1 Tax=Ectobacillus sp. JY-23 TaxID=2933872 RepID=UPI001FF6F7EB|nr:antA/AntB antirepressor family protein [Ectobacillus sp. JY-23]UOY94413.1 antA/AntB antirepressor family protein [Ectobacillus sp. JY-23]